MNTADLASDPQDITEEVLGFFASHLDRNEITKDILQDILSVGGWGHYYNESYRSRLTGTPWGGTYQPKTNITFQAYRYMESSVYLPNARLALQMVGGDEKQFRDYLAQKFITISYPNLFSTDAKWQRKFFLRMLTMFRILGDARDPVVLEYLSPYVKGLYSFRENQIFLQSTELAKIASAIIINYFAKLDMRIEGIRRQVLMWTLILANERVSPDLINQIFVHANTSEIEEALKLAKELYHRNADEKTVARNFQEEHRKREERRR